MNTYGIRYADGDVDIEGYTLTDLKDAYREAKIMERLGYPAYEGVEPVVLAEVTDAGAYVWEALDLTSLVE